MYLAYSKLTEVGVNFFVLGIQGTNIRLCIFL